MRRQTITGGACPAGTGRARLDPLALPVRFTASDAAADGLVRAVEIDRDRVLLRRRVRGMAMRVRLPIAAFLGVSVRLAASDQLCADTVAVRLEHRDPALSIELFSGVEDADAVAEWQLWARVLGLPLLVADRAGRLREPVPHIGAIRAGAPAPRRRRRNAIKRRRPSFPLRRRTNPPAGALVIHREREIIARN